MRAAGYDDVERGERGSTEEHLTVTQFKVQAERQRLEEMTAQVAQVEQSLSATEAAARKKAKELKALQSQTKEQRTAAMTVQEIQSVGKRTITGSITMTPSECETLKAYAVNGIAAKADNGRLQEQLRSARRDAGMWKRRYEQLYEKYQELKQKAQPYLDALEIASQRVRAFLDVSLARGRESQQHEQPARKRGRDMEI